MSTPRERAARFTPLGIVGVILVPLVVAGLLLWAFWSPEDRLETVTAAVVNNDSPVEVNGQTVPLGRQLSAELVGGDAETNYTWVLTSDEDAAAGLDEGTYAAVVTIPDNFSEAATSFSGDPADAERALIDVETGDKARLVDDAISQTITSTAASLMGRQLTETYLDNVYVGFNTLGDQLGEASDGASELADGAVSLADGAGQLADGTTSLADGASALAGGAGSLADGASQLADGAATAASGASEFAGQLGTFTGGVTQVTGGLEQLKQQTAALPGTASTLAGYTSGAASDSLAVAESVGAAAKEIGKLAATACTEDPASQLCAALSEQAESLVGTAERAGSVAENAGYANGYAQALAGNDPSQPGGLPALAGGIASLADGAAPLAAGAPQVAAGATTLASGISELSSGASGLAGGSAELASGTTELASGAGELATGATGIADGSSRLSNGSTTLADGLGQATEEIPSYTESERENLSGVVAEPVTTSGEPSIGFGSSSLPLYAVLALWIGAFATFILLGAVPARVLGSTRPSALLALRAFALPAVIGVIQGLLVTVVLGIAQSFSPSEWFAFGTIAVLAGVTFAAVNQALVGWLGGAGRFISMIVALVVLATGVISTVPAILDIVRDVLPVQPVINGMQAVLASDTGSVVTASAAGLVGWTLLALIATTLAVARTRTVSIRQLVAQPA
ncbi:YhgE/Pip domain-containing protein [Okibacterium endophyticum]